MRLRTLLIGLAVSAMAFGSLCEITWSQEEGRRGPPGGERGGPGGPGGRGPGGPGGFTGRGGGGGGIPGLIRMDEVQKELKLDEDQKKELAAIGDRMRESFGGGRPPGGGAPGGDRGAPGGDRGAPGGDRGRGGPGGGFSPDQMNEMMARMAAARDKSEAEIMAILDPDQSDRILGLLIQLEDGRSLQSPSLSEALTLTADQKAKLKAVSEKGNADRIELMQSARGGGGPEAGMMEKFEALSKKNNNDLLAVLTPDQKAKYESMKGAKFTFPESRGFGAGGPGGGSRGPGGPGGAPREGGRPGRPQTPGT